MAYELSGDLIETCSCNMLCPCWFGVQDLMVMDRGWCAGTLLFRIEKGESDGVDMTGRMLVVVFDFPGPTLFDGNATGRIHIDDGATEQQQAELEAIFQGKKGGPMQVLAGLVSKWLPTQSARIDLRQEGDTLRARVGSAGVVDSRLLKDESGRAMTVQNSGFASTWNFDDLSFTLAPSATRWSDPEMPRQFETRSGARASWTWSVS